INFSNGKSAPATTLVVPATTIMLVASANPDGVTIRRASPIATAPNPAVAPNPFATDPKIIRPGRNHNGFHRRWRRGLLNDHRGGGAVTGGARRVDHEINHLVAHAGIAQINDVRRAQMIYRVRILDLADDDLFADARLGERLHVRDAQRLTLFNPCVSLRSLRPQTRLLILINGVTDQTAGQQADCCAHQRAFAAAAI